MRIKKDFKKMLQILIIATAFAIFITGCGKADNEISGEDVVEDENATVLSGTVVTAGSTSVQPLTEMLIEEFNKIESEINVEALGGGSGQGIKAIEEGIADFGALSRGLKDEEKEKVDGTFVIAMDGVAVIVNSESSVEDLTVEQIKKIYVGEITNWKEVGGDDSPIVVVSREQGSGTRGAFTEITKITEKDANGNEVDNTTNEALIQSSTGAIKQTVGSTPGTIGYISLGALDDTVKAVKVESVEPSNETVLSEDYPIARPFLYVTGKDLSEEAQAFIDFVLSEKGQNVVEEAGFVPASK